MLEDIQVIVMSKLQRQRHKVAKWTRQCRPRITKRLDNNVVAHMFYHPIWSGDDGYHIMNNVDKYKVQLERRKCSCQAW